MPLSLAACAAEKKQLWSRFCISSPSVSKTRRRAGLRKDFAERFQIESKRVAERESFGQAGGVDVHHHVDQRFHFRGFARFTNETHRRRQLPKHRFCFPEGRLGPAAQQIKFPFAFLGS